MNEQLIGVPDESSRPPEPTRPLNPRGVVLGAVAALVLVGGVIAWVVTRGQGSSPAPRVVPVQPVALSASGLAKLGSLVGQPIYWAGPRRGYLYELKRTADGSVYIRYLPPGVEAGAKGHQYMIIATYPFPRALSALTKVADAGGIKVPGGGLALVDEKHPTSVHLAFPRIDYQVEVYDPSPARALAVASSGRVRPAR